MKISRLKILLMGILLCGCSLHESHENISKENSIAPTATSAMAFTISPTSASGAADSTTTSTHLNSESNWMAPLSIENIDYLEQVARLGNGYIQDVAVSPDESVLAVSAGTNIDIYDMETFELKQSIGAGQYLGNYFWIHNNGGNNLTFTSDSKKLIFSDGRWISIWDLTDNQEMTFFASLVPEWDVVNIGLSPKEDRVVVTTMGSSQRCDGRDMNFAVYDLDGKLIFDRYTCGDYANNFYRFTNDEKVLFIFASIMTSVYPTQTVLIDGASGTILENTYAEYTEYTNPKPNLELLYDISLDGQILAYAIYNIVDEKLDVHTKLVDFETQQVIHEQDGMVEFFVDQRQTRWQTISKDKSSTGTEAGICNINNAHRIDEYKTLFSSSEQVVFAVIHFRQIKSIELWNIPDCTVDKTISYPAAYNAMFSSDGQWLATTDRYHAYVWEVQTGKLHFMVAGEAFESPKDVIQFNMDGSRFLASTYGQDNIGREQPYQSYTISVYDTQTGQLVRELKPDSEFLKNIIATPENDLVIAQDTTNQHVWNIETGQKLATLPNGPFVFDLQAGYIWIAPQQKKDAQATHKIILFDYRTGEQVRELGQISTEEISGIYLDSSGEKLLAHLFLGRGKEEGAAVAFFDIENNGEEFLSYKLPWRHYDMSAYGNAFATDGWDDYVYLWNYEDDAPVLILWGTHRNWKVSDQYKDAKDEDDAYGMLIHPNRIETVFLDENILITEGTTLRFWDTNSGYLLGEMEPDYSFGNISISPKHDLIAVTGQDGIIRLWGVPNEP